MIIKITWDINYWIIFFVATFILPLLNEYYWAGDFTFKGKLQRAILRNVRYWTILGIIGIILGFYLFIIESFTM